jgi:hypothetical protein
MFEDISHSGDGGIYGELLMNRNLRGGYAFYHFAVVQFLILTRYGKHW